MLLLSTLSI